MISITVLILFILQMEKGHNFHLLMRSIYISQLVMAILMVMLLKSSNVRIALYVLGGYIIYRGCMIMSLPILGAIIIPKMLIFILSLSIRVLGARLAQR